jgi:hypothetical protein
MVTFSETGTEVTPTTLCRRAIRAADLELGPAHHLDASGSN